MAARSFGSRNTLRRLWDSAKAIWLEIPMPPQADGDAIDATLEANGIDDGYIRADRHPRCRARSGSIPTSAAIRRSSSLPTRSRSIRTNSTRTGSRSSPSASPATTRPHSNPRIKSLNYLNNILAKIEGLQAGCVEALMLNHKGEVAECTGDNIFLVRDGVLLTPPTDAGSSKASPALP